MNPAAHYDNHGAGRENEINSCGTIQYGNTVWLKWTAPTWGMARFQIGPDGRRRLHPACRRRRGRGRAAPAPREARVAKGETVWSSRSAATSRGPNTYRGPLHAHAERCATPTTTTTATPNAGDCKPWTTRSIRAQPEIRDDGIDQNCFAADDKARKPTTTGAFSMSGGRLTKFALNEALKGSRIVVTCKGGACRDRKIVVTRRLKRDVKRLKLPRRIVGPLRAGTRIRVEVTNPPEWMGRRFQWRLTSSSTYRYKGFCGVNGRWRSC